ncbi:hypothetical protein BU16DRAFT_539433 [Lophium mytilinum]|uniref:C2H2-type domain-containing protein n=1 Tax=Lophium mytilinum TaxID=390894 RepID=A0A6A6QTH2_9PEZI|nr:hypothetical protein BU16DRAFT_539433 [Lophium mytilinum]
MASRVSYRLASPFDIDLTAETLSYLCPKFNAAGQYHDADAHLQNTYHTERGQAYFSIEKDSISDGLAPGSGSSLLLDGGPQQPRKAHKPAPKRGPALAYLLGNTIIVEDAYGKVLMKYDIPGTDPYLENSEPEGSETCSNFSHSFLPQLGPPDVDFSQFDGLFSSDSPLSINDSSPRPDSQFSASESPPMPELQATPSPSPSERSISEKHGPFVCNVPHCRRDGKPFKKKGDFRRHQLLHGPAIWMCPMDFCPYRKKGFSRKDKLVSHLERGHRESKEMAKMLAWDPMKPLKSSGSEKEGSKMDWAEGELGLEFV